MYYHAGSDLIRGTTDPIAVLSFASRTFSLRLSDLPRSGNFLDVLLRVVTQSFADVAVRSCFVLWSQHIGKANRHLSAKIAARLYSCKRGALRICN